MNTKTIAAFLVILAVGYLAYANLHKKIAYQAEICTILLEINQNQQKVDILHNEALDTLYNRQLRLLNHIVATNETVLDIRKELAGYRRVVIAKREIAEPN